jgi:hypothetical protein
MPAQFHEVAGGRRVAGYPASAQHPRQDFTKSRLAHRLHIDLVVDAPQESLVGKVRGVQIGGENYHDFERDAKLLPVLEREVVYPPVERHDPAVQQVARRDDLATEVVDHHNAVVRLHLQRSCINARSAVGAQLEHLRNQLPAYGYARAMAQHPARIQPVGLLVERSVRDWVEYGDDVATQLQGIGDHHRILVDAE